jgi:7-carboxy-7-deazaguanine synthase
MELLTDTFPEVQNLPLMESFYTLQGEGFYSGHAAYFIRLGGCDVGCHWCDVKESWPVENHPQVPVSTIVAQAKQYLGKTIVVTGGEPLMHNLEPLTTQLKAEGFSTHIESSGVCRELSGSWDWFCFSPKKFKEPNPAVYALAHELKIIVYNQSDFAFALDHANKVTSSCKLYLQPEWGKREEITPLIVDFIKENPTWKLSLQTHKYINIP